MKAEKLQRRLQWYRITGHFVDDANRLVVAYVEATSRNKVLRYHGGRRQQRGTGVVIEFPTEPRQVQLLGRKLTESLDGSSDAVVEVIPVTRYRCDCGKEHVSEHPYPSVWCSCGHKAYPIPR